MTTKVHNKWFTIDCYMHFPCEKWENDRSVLQVDPPHACCRHLSNLQYLGAGENNLTGIPKEIGKTASLLSYIQVVCGLYVWQLLNLCLNHWPSLNLDANYSFERCSLGPNLICNSLSLQYTTRLLSHLNSDTKHIHLPIWKWVRWIFFFWWRGVLCHHVNLYLKAQNLLVTMWIS